MGETLSREFKFGNVQNERQPMDERLPNGGFIPDYIANHLNSRPSWLSSFVGNLPAALEGSSQAEDTGGDATGAALGGLAGAFGNIQKVNRQAEAYKLNQQQQMLENLFKQRQLDISQGHLDVAQQAEQRAALPKPQGAPSNEIELLMEAAKNNPQAQAALEMLKQMKEKPPKEPTSELGIYLEQNPGKSVLDFWRDKAKIESIFKPNKEEKPATVDERKAAYHFRNAQNSNKEVSSYEDSLRNLSGQIEANRLPNILKGEGAQKYKAAAERWVRAVGFLESGATVPPDELKQAMRIYFAQEGDKPETIEAKRQLRANTEQNMQSLAGRGITGGGGKATHKFNPATGKIEAY